MLYTAILIACLVSDPSDCKTHEMIIQGNGIPYAPAVEAQSRAAAWLAEHPGYAKKTLKVVVGRGA